MSLSLLEEVGIITLVRPDALNALNEDLLAQIATLVDEVVCSPSGQHWVRRFLAKDPAQSSFLTLLPPEKPD